MGIRPELWTSSQKLQILTIIKIGSVIHLNEIDRTLLLFIRDTEQNCVTQGSITIETFYLT